ncbi:MAG: hypothetical protein ACM3PV_06535, partial [Betaproteobacteria bacterium]
MKTTLYAAVVALALAAPAAADRADDDLAAVKRAVAAAPARAAEATARPAAEEEPAPARRRGAEPRWFRLRVVDKTGKGSRVSLNLPLGIVRAFADDWPLPVCRRGAKGRGPTIGEVLR